MAPKLTPARINQLAANPATRKAIPDRYLPDEYRPARAAAIAAKQPVAPGITRGDINQQAAQQTNEKYRPVESAQADQAAQNTRQASRQQNWFEDYQRQLTQAAADQRVRTQQAAQSVADLGAGLDKSSAQNWAGVNQAMTADATQRGATVDPKVGQVAQAASTNRLALAGSYGAALFANGTNTADALKARADNRVPAQANAAAGQYSDAGDKIAKDRAQTARDRAEYRINARSTLTSAATDSALKASLTQANIAQTQASTGATKQRTERTQAENAFLKAHGYYPGTSNPKDQASLKYFDAHGYFPPTGPPKTPAAASKWLATAGQNAAKDKIDSAVALAQKLKATHTRQEAAQLMLNGRPAVTVTSSNGTTQTTLPAIPKVSKDYASTALDIAYSGHVSKRNVSALHGRKLKVKPLGYPTNGK